MLTYKKALTTIFKNVKEILAPPPDLKISEWAAQYRYMSGDSSPEPGKYNSDRAKYQVDIMDAFCDPKIETIVGMLPAQSGKSTIIENVMGYFAHLVKLPLLLVRPTQTDAEDFSKERIAPMIRDTPVLLKLFGDQKSRDSGNTLTRKKFNGGFWAMVGANSPMDLAGRPAPIVLCDETDRYPESSGAEGDPIEIVTKRASNFWNRKIGIFSTPTDEYTSKVAYWFGKSDQRKYHVKCPHCNHEQILLFKNLSYKLDEEKKVIPQSIEYICKECNKGIPESKKNSMVRNGRYIATRPTYKIAGFWINALYSPWVLWETVAQEYEDSKDSPMKYKTWVNTRACEVYKEVGTKPDWEEVYSRREFYPRGVVPTGGILLVAGADVQHDRIEVEILAYGKGLESWSVDYRVLLGNTAQIEVWNDLTDLLNEEFEHENGSKMKIKKIGVDASDGQRSSWVYSWCRAIGVKKAMALKGSSLRQTTMISTPKAQDFDFQGKKYPKGVYLTIVGTEIIKFELYSQVKMKAVKSEDGSILSYPKGYCHFPDYPESYFKMFLAEEIRIKKLNNGGVKYEFFNPPGKRNESLDCRVYARAVATSLMVDHFTESHWDRLAAILIRDPNYRPPKDRPQQQAQTSQPVREVGFGMSNPQPQSQQRKRTVSRPIG
jgi:phage terminase large subunit GpA-like protein